MARLRLSRHRVEAGDLPHYCLRCGAPADLIREKTFSWHPEWIDTILVLGLCLVHVLLIVGIVLAIAFSKRMRVPVPLCRAHANHWRWRWLSIGLSLAGVLLVAASGITLLVVSDRLPLALRNVGGPVLLASVGLFIVWLVTAAFLQNSAIRAREITDDGITLIKVSPEFVRRFEDYRGAERLPEEFDEPDDDEDFERRDLDVRIRRGRRGETSIEE